MIFGDKMAIGENVKRLRQDKGLTQGDLAKLSSIKMGHISKIERNETDPKTSTLYKLMDSLNCSADSLLFEEDNIRSNNTSKMMLERMEELPEEDKKTIFNVIDAICIANGMDNIFKHRKWAILNKPTNRISKSL